MEGLIPYVYRAIMQRKNGKRHGLVGSWLCESPSTSYVRLSVGDSSGRFQPPFPSDCSFRFSPSDMPPSGHSARNYTVVKPPAASRYI